VIRARYRVLSGVAATAAALTLAACSSSGSSGSATSKVAGSTASASASGSAGSLSSELPASIRSSGVIHLATSTAFPPYDFTNAGSNTIVGFEPDLRAALGKLLGVSFDTTVVQFPELIPGIQAKRFDAAQDGISDTTQREGEVDFVNYAQGGASVILTLTKNAAGVTGLTALCGKTLGSPQGTQGGITPAQIDKQCAQAGKPNVKDTVFPDAPDIQLALKAGRVDFQLEDGPTGGYDAKTSNGQITAIPAPGTADPTKMGIVVPKGSTQLEKALQDAFNQLIANGTYKQILDKWGVSTIALSGQSTVNGATS
jgi:polar amino acid transport system substrate-binding protein